jgi:hypothetical protein
LPIEPAGAFQFPATKPRKVFDGHGLCLLVKPSGAKAWLMAYRIAGKPQTSIRFAELPDI